MLEIKPRKKLRARLVTYNLSLIICVILVCVLFSVQYISITLRNQIVAGYSAVLELTTLQIRNMQSDIEQMSRIIVSDMQILSTLGSVELDTFDTVFKRMQTSSLLANYKVMRDYIIGIDLILEEGPVFSSMLNERGGIISNTDRAWYYDLRSRVNTSGFSDVHEAVLWDRRIDVITYYTICNNLLTFEQNFAHLLLYIDVSLFEDVLYYALQDYEWIVLLSAGRQLISKSGEAVPEQAKLEFILGNFQGGTPFLQYDSSTMFINRDLDDGWVLLLSVPDTLITSRVNVIYQFFLILTAVIVVVVVTTIIPLSFSFTKPLERLTDMAQAVSEGNLDVRLDTVSQDEFGILANVFNEMAASLQSHMRQVLIDQKEKESLRMDLLMAQINPHFIYNTLDSMIYLSHLGRNRDVCDVGRIFVQILHDNLKIGPENVIATIAEEIISVQNYTSIQSYRYPGRFTVNINVSEDISAEYVPRFLLQPLVENALFHGILPIEKTGNIFINIWMEATMLNITIRDDGIGMSQKKIKALFSKDFVGTASQMRSIGLYNIRERLKRIYKDRFVLEIASEPGEGTLISISLPTNFAY